MTATENVQPCNSTVEGHSSRRIAYNSVFLFLRFAFLMALNLYSVRFVLRGLGEVDYGTYSAVASIVLTGACITPVLSLSMQRYYSFALGQNDSRAFSDIFSASINMVLVVVLMLAVLFETVGFGCLGYLTIPAERMDAAMWVYHCSLVSFFLTLLQIPFLAAIYAHEDMGIYSLVSAVECVLKFLAALFIVHVGMDGLVFYGVSLLAIALLVWMAYAAVALSRYKACVYRLRGVRRGLYRELLSFSGWTFYGSLASMGMIQGSVILLNMFFGPLLNAAFGISVTIYNALNAVTNSVVLAFRPAMVKCYAEGRHDALNKMFSIGNMSLLLLMLLVSVPLLFEMPYVLTLWLGDYPAYTPLFCRMMIVNAVILALHNPITTIIQAQGNIRTYFLVVETVTILIAPVSLAVFMLGGQAFALSIVMTAFIAMAHVMRVYCLNRQYGHFSLRGYLGGVVLRGAALAVLCAAAAWTVHSCMQSGLLRLVAVGAVVFIIMLAAAVVVKRGYHVARI